jgi:hypothetical protein
MALTIAVGATSKGARRGTCAVLLILVFPLMLLVAPNLWAWYLLVVALSCIPIAASRRRFLGIFAAYFLATTLVVAYHNFASVLYAPGPLSVELVKIVGLGATFALACLAVSATIRTGRSSKEQ